MRAKLMFVALVLGLSVASTARAAVPVLEWTETIIGGPAALETSFTISSLLPHKVTLTDNGFLAPFEFVALGVFKTGGATMGTIVGPGTFSFTPTVLGSYTATLVGLAGTIEGLAVSTFGVTITAVPEPEAWAMLVAGLGLVGMQVRRRRLASARFAIR